MPDGANEVSEVEGIALNLYFRKKLKRSVIIFFDGRYLTNKHYQDISKMSA